LEDDEARTQFISLVTLKLTYFVNQLAFQGNGNFITVQYEFNPEDRKCKHVVSVKNKNRHSEKAERSNRY
jgi:hypothetical protein